MAFFGVAPQFSLAGDYNDLVLKQVRQMPKGGRYSVSHFAKIRLQSSAHFESGKFFIIPSGPSFCSGATYLVFIRTIEALRERGQLRLDYGTLERLIIRDQHDGEGIWGRWNANGPGTARLFHELRLGRNFDNIDQAKPGDFMKFSGRARLAETSTGIPPFFWEWRIGRMVSTFVTGQAMFLRVTARRACREAKSHTRSSRVLKPRAIWSASLARLWLIPIWPLCSEVAPAFRRPAQSAGCSGLLLKYIVQRNNSGGAQQVRQRNPLAFGMSSS